MQSDDLGATQAWTPQPIDVEAAGQEASQVAYDDSFNVNDVADDEQSGSNRFRPWHGGAYSARRMENSNLSSEELADEAAAAAVPTPVELNEVYQFRNPDIDAEVWFVALGSELAQNSGMKAFLEAHQSELRGAFIVDIDAIGAGDLTMIEREGFLKPSKASSRMKRYIRKASQATGTKVHPVRCSARKALHRMRRSMAARLPIWWAWKAASPRCTASKMTSSRTSTRRNWPPTWTFLWSC